MRSSLRQSLALCAILLTATIAAPPAMAASRETIAMSVGRLLEEGHYTRQKSSWPKDDAEADQLWRGRIANELLQEHLSEHPIEPPAQLVARRYDRLARNVHEEDKDEQMKLFLDALAQAYDPHSEYLSKADMKNFSINMGLSLVGIGAMLRSEDGYAKIESLVPGS